MTLGRAAILATLFAFGLTPPLNGAKADEKAALPAPLILSAPDVIPTNDGSGNPRGRLWGFELTLSRQYTPDNQLVTPYTLNYWFGNGNAGEYQGGNETFSINLLDNSGNIVVPSVL